MTACNHICRECGKHETGSWMADKQEDLEARQLCFGCGFWEEHVDRKDNSNVARIDGVHYIIGNPNQRRFRGFAGRRFEIIFDDGREVETNNLWCQGKIPQRFKDRLPNNAVFKEQP